MRETLLLAALTVLWAAGEALWWSEAAQAKIAVTARRLAS